MPIKTFLCCFDVYEGSWVCGLCNLFLGAVRVYLQWFNLEFRHRMAAAARKQLQINFTTLQLITMLQMSAAAVSIAVSLLMLIGLSLFKRQRWLLFPWLVWIVIEELFSISVIFFFAAFHVKLKCSVYISDAVMFVTSMYFMLCVYSHFHQLRLQDRINRYRAAVHISLDDDFDEESSAPQRNRPV